MTLPPHMLGMQNNDPIPSLGHHRFSQSFAARSPLSNDNAGSNFAPSHAPKSSFSGYAEKQPSRGNNIQPINTTRQMPPNPYNVDLHSPQAGVDMNFTPLLPSGLLMGSPFQPGSPTTFQPSQFQSFSSIAPHPSAARNNHPNYFQQPAALSPNLYQSLASPTAYSPPTYFGGLASPTATAFSPMGPGNMGGYGAPMQMAPAYATGTSRTVYLGNIPADTSAEELLGHVRSGPIESVRILSDKNCAFISFLDGSSATHFHSDAILKKLSIKGQDIKIGWGKPSSVPTSVALAVQQSGASRNVYLGNLPEDMTENELREDLSKFGQIDTVKLVREKAIGFVHFLSIGNAVKAVSQLPQDPKWQPPRRVYYGKDRCAYVSKTQQQNAAQYLGIAPGYAHVLNGADRDLITNALAQQSVAAAAVATTAGGVNNLGNRTVYLGNIHPETTIEEICNVVRGGLLHHIRYIPDKHICFVTFIDPTSAASFYALSNLQGLMIHNRRLKIGWGKHSGGLPPAIALAVSGGASRNVYIGNLDEAWTEERLRQDFQEYGEIELVNTLREKSCAFVNFTNIANAIKAIEAVRGKEEYKRFKVNFGKDRCGNPPRQVLSQQQLQQQQQQQQGQQGQDNSVSSPSPTALQQSRAQSSISPASSGAANGSYNPLNGPTASTFLNHGNNNPLTLYLAASHQNAQQAAADQRQQQQDDFASQSYGAERVNHHPSTFYNSANAQQRPTNLDPSPHHPITHATHQSMHLTNGLGASTSPGAAYNPYDRPSAASESQHSKAANLHSRTVSLPAFSLQAHHPQQQPTGALSGLGSGIGGFGGAGAFGLGVSSEGSGMPLPGWAEEEVV